MMRYFFSLATRWIIVWLLFPVTVLAQQGTPYPRRPKDLLDVGRDLFHIQSRPRTGGLKRIYFSILPTSTQAASPSGFSVTATTAAFALGEPGNTSLSTVTFAPYVATQGRLGFSLRSNVWLSGNNWDILGDSRLLYYPQDTWGLGGQPDRSRLLCQFRLSDEPGIPGEHHHVELRLCRFPEIYSV